jgi:predicted N-acetyltransferase YhbS
MKIHIRTETSNDYSTVFNLVGKAFANEPYSDQQEQFLVERLRKSNAFIPELSLVAEVDKQIVGFILLTKIQIKNTTQSTEALALAPVAVLPNFQGQGIGGQLIEFAHQKAKALGFKIIVLVGHEHYYPRFGYKQTEKYGIHLPFEVPAPNAMILALEDGVLDDVNGMVVYAKAFFE